MISGCVLVQLFVEDSMYDQRLCISTIVCGSLDI